MIGLRQGTVELLPYDGTWPSEFAKEADRLGTVFGSDVKIEHVGSTAISGLIAKPLIDMQVGLESLADAKHLIPRLVELGYYYMPERDKPDEVFMPKGPEELRTHYLHIVEIGSERWKNTLLFRDYLRTHSDARDDYARLKQELAQQYGDYRPAYTEAKTAFVASIIEKANSEQPHV